MKRMTCLAVVLATLMLAAPSVTWAQPPAAQPQTDAARDGFVPVKDLPAAEQLPAAPLVIAAYAFIWVAALGYLWVIWRRLGAVDRELATLRRSITTRQ